MRREKTIFAVGCLIFYIFAADAGAPFYDEGENLSFPKCGMWHRYENRSSWLAYLRHKSEHCYGIVISHRTILTHKPDECRIQQRDLQSVQVFVGDCASESVFDQRQCVGKHFRVQRVFALSQNASAGEQAIFVRLYTTTQSLDVNPVCLFNRDRALDDSAPDSLYFALHHSSQGQSGNWWHSLAPQSIVSREECFKNQSIDAKVLATMSLNARDLICVRQQFSFPGRYLVNFYKGRYFLRGLRLKSNKMDVYLDIMQYVRSIGLYAKDIAVFPSVPRDLPAKEFNNAENLSFRECGLKRALARQKRSDHEQATPFVYLGFEALEDAHPWHADVSNLAFGTRCGGTLISKTTILTAAHCIFRKNAGDFEVTIGAYDKRLDADAKRQTLTPSKLLTHPSYASGQFHHDLGLLLFEPAGFRINDHVRPICLWNEASSLERVAGKQATLVGFGLAENFTVPTKLQEAKIPVRGNEECYLSNRTFFGKHLKPGDNFCAGHVRGPSACVGDSGGSLSLAAADGRWFIRGVVSFGMAKVISPQGDRRVVCNPEGFSLFADVAFYLDWIVKNTPDIFFKT